jgi:hypothetical protein
MAEAALYISVKFHEYMYACVAQIGVKNHTRGTVAGACTLIDATCIRYTDISAHSYLHVGSDSHY